MSALIRHPAAASSRDDVAASMRAVLGTPHVPRVLTGSLVGRLPVAAAPLAILLCLADTGSGYGWASAVAAIYGLAATIGQPALGRLADRYGQKATLLGSASASCVALGTLAALQPHAHALCAVAAAVAGAATPPLEGALRALWPRMVPQHLQQAALGMDVASQSVLFALGPLLVTALVSLSGPTAALALVGSIGLVGTWTMASSGPSRSQHGHPQRGDWLGPLRSRELRAMASVLGLVGVCLGAQNVAAPAWAQQDGSRAGAGLLLGAFSAGSAIGGVIFTRRRETGIRALALCLLAFTFGWIPLVAAPSQLWLMTALAVLPGLALSPLLGRVFERVGRAVEPTWATEAFSWLVTAVGIGSAAGTAAVGALIDRTGPSAAYGFAGACAAGALTLLAFQQPRPRKKKRTHATAPVGS
ncbi:MFS transporter [Kitasatospora aureofaciens]|uniref:MFS transporter n=1 Tax=Kitasatospora aureofaciens TaxID=1894 RepID=UPI0006922F04|nr:MFS transporter [Kitasatospora aureofaciens]